VELTDFRDPLDECADDATRSAVRRAVNQLPASYARILELRFGDDLTVPEIAKILQLSESAAESRLSRARQAFRESWKNSDPAGSASATPGLREIP
jgi:RNA polymerase sigma factor (sigma-70 family)